ncbi:MAG: hypothetical protein RL693_813 [Verrucomicrobiota bacterium]|jgi:O-methyltransferase
MIDMPLNMKNQSYQAYVHLLKQTLAFMLWPEPLVPVDAKDYKTHGKVKLTFFRLLESLAKLGNIQLSKRSFHTQLERIEGRVWRNYPHTMIGLHRLDNIQECTEAVLRDGVPGDFIETGAWRGGACIFMRGLLTAAHVSDRKVYVADSFEGLPEPDESTYPSDKGDTHHLYDFLAVDIDTVKQNFADYGLLDDQVVFLKGWFKDTLPAAPIDKLAILRLDGDMYSSTMEALEILYPKLSPGGFCIVDDYHLSGCQQAIDDYRKSHSITQPLQAIDWAGRFWRK